MTPINIIKAPIIDELNKFEPFFQDTLKSNVPLLQLITNYIYRQKGKQMRPMVVFLCAKLNGQVNDSTFYASSFIELLHTATLIHDDVVDESYERRGLFSINALWRNKISVLVGDFLLSKGMLLAVEHNEFRVLRIVSNAVKEMSEGELLQIEKSRKLNITEEVYFEIIRKKTATLLAACSSSGASSVKSDEETIEKMRKFGEYLGIAFQIKDDIFDYQAKGLLGKPTANDIKERKMTLPLIHVLSKADPATKKKLLSIISKKNKRNEEIAHVIQYVVENGGLDYAAAVMDEYKNKALRILDEYPESEVKKSLVALTVYTTERKS